jgi:ankyrin repeat protein
MRTQKAFKKVGRLSRYRPIHQACLACDAPSVRAILKRNPTALDLPDDSNRTPLHLAASRNCANIIAILLYAGAKLEARGAAGETALHVAAQEGCADAVRMLVGAGANINARDKQRNTPFRRALLWNQIDVANLLKS